MRWKDGHIAVDWGTTNRRAYLVDGSGCLLSDFEDGKGVTSVEANGFDAAVAEIRARLGDLPMLMAGMIGSNRGWREAAYVPCPAGLDSLARAILWVEEGRTGIVPGVCQTGPAGADVMRGEEVQILGAIAGAMVPADGVICHPGTHAKWIVTAQGQINAFRTMMTGELFGLLQKHSILADLIDHDVTPGDAFAAGVDEALAGGDVLSGLFRIRARHLLGTSVDAGEDDAGSYASGLLIGCDIRVGLDLAEGREVALIGRPELCTLYAAALGRAGRASTTLDGSAAFLAGIQHLVNRL